MSDTHHVPGRGQYTRVTAPIPFRPPKHMTEEEMEFYRWRGTAVHKMIEDLSAGTFDPGKHDPIVLPYYTAYKRFVDDYGWKPVISEFEVISHTMKLVGHPDGLGEMDGYDYFVLLDFKTGVPRPTVGPQTSAYKMLIEEMHEKYLAGDKARVREFKPIKDALGHTVKTFEPSRIHRVSVHLSDRQGKYKVERWTEPEDLTQYVRWLNSYRWEQKKGMI